MIKKGYTMRSKFTNQCKHCKDIINVGDDVYVVLSTGFCMKCKPKLEAQLLEHNEKENDRK